MFRMSQIALSSSIGGVAIILWHIRTHSTGSGREIKLGKTITRTDRRGKLCQKSRSHAMHFAQIVCVVVLADRPHAVTKPNENVNRNAFVIYNLGTLLRCYSSADNNNNMKWCLKRAHCSVYRSLTRHWRYENSEIKINYYIERALSAHSCEWARE